MLQLFAMWKLINATQLYEAVTMSLYNIKRKHNNNTNISLYTAKIKLFVLSAGINYRW